MELSARLNGCETTGRSAGGAAARSFLFSVQNSKMRSSSGPMAFSSHDMMASISAFGSAKPRFCALGETQQAFEAQVRHPGSARNAGECKKSTK